MIESLCAIIIIIISIIFYYRNSIPCFSQKKFQTIGVQTRTQVKEVFCQVDISVKDTECQADVEMKAKQCQTVVREIICHQERTEPKEKTGEKTTGPTLDFAHTCELCESGQDLQATAYCENCLQFLCAACEIMHKSCSTTSVHAMVSLDQLDELLITKPLYHRKPFQISTLNNMKGNKCYKNSKQQSSAGKFIAAGPFSLLNREMAFLHLNWDCCNKSEDGRNSVRFEITNPDTRETHNFLSCETRENISDFKNCQFCCEEDGSKIYFTIPSQKTVYLYKGIHEGTGQYEQAFQTVGMCHGIAFFDNGLAITVENSSNFDQIPTRHVEYLTFTGKVKQRILYNQDKNMLFFYNSDKYIASNFEQDVLYISRTGRNTVLALGVQGQTLFRISGDLIKWPRGICTDKEGNIYIACLNSVVQVQRDGSKPRALLTLTDKQKTNAIQDVFFHNQSQTLAVIEDDTNASVFEFLK